MTDRQVSASLSPALNFPQASPTPCISWIAAQQRVICLHSAGLHPLSQAPANRSTKKISSDEILGVRRVLERMITSFSEIGAMLCVGHNFDYDVSAIVCKPDA